MTRVIRKLDIKGERVKATRCMEGLQEVGDLRQILMHHEASFQTEIFLNNFTATLFGSGPMSSSLLAEVRKIISYPLIVGGAISSIESAASLFESGADRITINTAALEDQELLIRLVSAFGAQAVIPSVHCRLVDNEYRLFTRMGREIVERSLTSWLQTLASIDAIEVLVTSISTEGTGRGFPPDLANLVCDLVEPKRVILCGGLSKNEDMQAMTNLNVGVNFAAATLFRSTVG